VLGYPQRMQVGMNLPVMAPGLDRDTVRQWCRSVDEGPFSSIAAGERITFPNPEIMVTLSAAAAWTERVKIAFHVLVVPMHDPIWAAKQVATLDVLSGGRVSLGVGVGARDEDYRAVGAVWDERLLSRMEDGVSRMRQAWAGEMVVEGAARPVEPAPLQAGGPEILAGVLMPKAIRRAAKWADGISGFSFGPTSEDVAMRFDAAREAWREAGRERAPRLVTGFWYALGDNPKQQLGSYLERYLAFMGQGTGTALAPSVSATSKQALRDALLMVRDLGADEVMLVPTSTDPNEVDRAAEIVGSL
jgi:alkanesulfonate monooxygenase SsuD/methylene tetrahydromethanopterin reductase-like flavin-dependent oxidoreductase (luciferase family)